MERDLAKERESKIDEARVCESLNDNEEITRFFAIEVEDYHKRERGRAFTTTKRGFTVKEVSVV